MTDEQKAAANAKRKATYEAKRQREQERKEEHQHTIEILKGIRDNPDAADADRLKAVELLTECKHLYY